MKLIVAIVRPELLACLQTPLKKFDVESMTVTEIHDYGPAQEHTLIYRSSQIRVRSSPKLRLEIVVNDVDADDALDAIVDAAVPVTRDSRSDCKIFVVSLEHFLEVSQREPQRTPALPRPY